MPHTNHKNPLVTCPECGTRFELLHPSAVFCSNPCKRAYFNRDVSTGSSLVILAKAWRLGRHKKGDPIPAYALALFCAAIDEANAQDRAAGRLSALEVLRNRHRRQGLGGTEVVPPKKPARASGRVRPRAQETSCPA